MNGLERTNRFLRGEDVDRPPFHPIIMRWAARYAGVKYRDFCTIPAEKCRAMIRCAEGFDIDWVTVMSDPWAEASAFGIRVEYPEDALPVDTGGHLPDAAAASGLKPCDPLRNSRCRNRIREIEIYRKLTRGRFFIVGWVEGPVAEYVDLRKASEASVDFLTEPDAVEKAMEVITENAMVFIDLQIAAGAHCIGIGDSFCSQIGPELYYRFAFERQKRLVEFIHSRNALAKIHICGNTESILEGVIKTGADIIDIDHMVPSMKEFTRLLADHQVFSGKSDPVTVIQNGDIQSITESVRSDFQDAGGRCIVSAGCEITPETSTENMKLFSNAAKLL
ncbi:MAG TPA: uroporphyrinogen decarboxylase family protein [Bacteroidales bacterium]|jgi:MtaA/CmuA family methyltransferase|nr:uroporphyrinogen decarboxylase family protein [Bacteroidales bacterium]HQH25642.1 uroporphyrinogen decarboxylase family protein [Bacteroidales bacterium]HQJ83230.1 uroporphyrinogen decarboxylase family protein [Bacteroidales bacterium]